MSSDRSEETHTPKWAPHVHGVYRRELDDEGKPVPTWVHLSCDVCKATHRVRCDSGAPIAWVQRWARVHLHRDPLKDPFPEQKR